MDDFHKQPTVPGPEAEEAAQEIYPIPEVIGPYKIESLLEIGGMSTVYLGTHPETLDPVTVKTLLPKFLSNQEVIERFLNESEIIAKTDHPNVVKLYGQGKWKDGLYIAMEFIEGVSLRQYLQHHPISLRRALEIILEIAYALCHLHTHGIIHRDLKLENILVTKSGNIKVIDFGIAQLLSDKKNISAFQKPRIIGTPIYMSPEQRQDPDSVSYPSDIYSLGIIAYELVLGKLSHGRVHLALMPKGFQKILAKALQPRPEDRYRDAVDFISAISGYMNSTTLEKEENGRMSGLLESIQYAQTNLLPKGAPDWEHIKIGIATDKGTKISGIYYDYLHFPDQTYGVVIAETKEAGADGVVYTGVLRGMVRTLGQTTSDVVKIAEKLNAILIEDPIHQAFPLSFICLSPENNSLSYLSCFGTLWHIKQENQENIDTLSPNNPLIGIKKEVIFQAHTISWNPGDTFIYTTHKESEKLLQAIKDTQSLSPQKQAEAILRKIKPLKPEEQFSSLILSISRTQ